MFLLALSCPVVFVVFRFLWVDKRIPIDEFVAVGLVLIPGLLVISLQYFVPQPYADFAYLLYWIVPTLILKQESDMGWGKAILQGLVVLLIVVAFSVYLAKLFGTVHAFQIGWLPSPSMLTAA